MTRGPTSLSCWSAWPWELCTTVEAGKHMKSLNELQFPTLPLHSTNWNSANYRIWRNALSALPLSLWRVTQNSYLLWYFSESLSNTCHVKPSYHPSFIEDQGSDFTGQLKVHFSFHSIILMDTRLLRLNLTQTWQMSRHWDLRDFSTQYIIFGLVIYEDHRKTPPKALGWTKFDCDNN